MSLFSKLFGGGSGDAPKAPPAESHDYDGYTIAPDPIREGQHYRLAATITKEIGGQTKTHRLIRADTMGDRDVAVAAALAKAKMLIDQQGDAIFE